MRKLLLIVAALAALMAPALAEPLDQYLPRHELTPGVARADLTVDQICTTKWGHDARAVTASMKRQVFEAYGFPKLNEDERCPCEIDHLISRELGGADDVKNLWPQSYSGDWNARMKDRLENRLHKEVCEGRLPLEDAQRGIADDWIALYQNYFGAEAKALPPK